MKRYILLLTTIAFFLLSITAFADSEATTVSLSNVSGKNGETVDLTVDLSGCSGFSNIDLEIGYDDSVLSLVEVTNAIAGPFFTKAPNLSSNPYNVSWNASENVVFSGTMLTLRFEISSTAGTGVYPVTVDYYKGREGTNVDGYHVNYDENFIPLNMTYSNGSIKVESSNVEEELPEGIYVGVESKSCKKGENVEVPLILYNNTGFTNISIELDYNSSVLTLVEITEGTSGVDMTTAEDCSVKPYNISWNGVENVDFNGTLATLKFAVSEDAEYGEYPITVSYYKGRNGTYVDGYHVNFNEEFEALELSYVNGSVSVRPEEYILSAKKEELDEAIALEIHAASPDEMKGFVFVAVYDGNRTVNTYIRNAADTVNVEVEKNITKIKVMWIDVERGFSPLCEAIELPLENS